jgi:8-oxo-dGTP pyrophosphatase MutT (NUDIX family)
MNPGEKVFVIVYRITNKNLEFLALKPGYEPDRNTKDYVITGGVEDYDKSFEDAAFRETYEEIGIKSNSIVDLEYTINYTDHITSEKFAEHCFGIKVGEESITLNEEHLGYKWLDKNEFINTIWWDYDKTILKNMISIIEKQVEVDNCSAV